MDHDAAERLAQSIRQRGWGPLANVLLGIAEPLGPALSQVITLMHPLAPGTLRGTLERWTHVLENPDQIQHLMQAIEGQDNAASGRQS